MVTETKPREKVIDLTGKRLFFELLHNARELKKDYRPHLRLMVLAGMKIVMRDNHEDFIIADNMRSYWSNLSAGSEGAE